MKKPFLFNFEVDKDKLQIKVDRSFDADVNLVWKAWTTAEILDKWWAPLPWMAVTKSMDFTEGGHWLYAMVSPEGEKHWANVEYIKINPNTFFSAMDSFSDEEGNRLQGMPQNKWENQFTGNGDQTIVKILLTLNTLEDLEMMVKMGFKEGFTSGLENLDRYIINQKSQIN